MSFPFSMIDLMLHFGRKCAFHDLWDIAMDPSRNIYKRNLQVTCRSRS